MGLSCKPDPLGEPNLAYQEILAPLETVTDEKGL